MDWDCADRWQGRVALSWKVLIPTNANRRTFNIHTAILGIQRPFVAFTSDVGSHIEEWKNLFHTGG